MKSIAFFSYKGGVGRTLAAANFAVYLAKLGLNVVIADFDLDAPGVDSKFPDFVLPRGQLGLIDYILRFQRDNSAPGPVKDIYCSVPISSPRQRCSLGFLPAGDYVHEDYPAKLNELNWSKIFSDQRDGVAFFQVFLERIKAELSPDVLVIDSRTGFSEIGGLCTQQLADETVILSSLASESVKMTRHLAKVIRESEISKRLGKTVETKIVVCRVPKPREIEKLKARCCKNFEVEETKLFFLFSCPGLEEEEFVAMLYTQKEGELVSNYMQLFQGLNVEVAQKSIREEIERSEKGLLSCTPAEAEARIRELAALYPHPEVFRRAMRFFNLTRRPEEASIFALRLLDLLPDDIEAQVQFAHFVLKRDAFFAVQGENIVFRHPGWERDLARRLSESVDARRMVSISERAYATGQLSVKEKVSLANMLEDLGENEKSYQIAKKSIGSAEMIDEEPELHLEAMGIAARTAMKLGNKEEAANLVSKLPITRLGGGLGNLAIQLKIEAGDKEGAFEIAKAILSRKLYDPVIKSAIKLAEELGRRQELEDLMRTHPDLEKGKRISPEIVAEFERIGFDFGDFFEGSPVVRHGGVIRRPKDS
jgi:MinD-like ATPase involved in chromosome partitioning or flagellar assembly